MYQILQVINVTFESSVKNMFFDKQQGAVYMSMINVKKTSNFA